MQKPNNAALAASTQPEAVQAGKKRVKKPAPGRKKRRTGAQSTGLGLSTKIVVFLTLILFAFAAIGLLISSTNFRNALRSGLVQEGTAAAATLATIAPSFLAAGDTTELQTLASQEAGNSETYYVWISNNQEEVVVHTFVPFIPQEVMQAAATVSEEGTQLTYRNLETTQIQNVLQFAAPILDGQLGTVYVGMNLDNVNAQATGGLITLLVVFGILTLIVVGLAAVFANRIVNPIRSLVSVSSRVGRGDLSKLADVKSNDEIGLLAKTINNTIVRLRGMVQTEEDRDEERRQRELLQANVGAFLDVAMDIADGDLTKRGQVSEDVLGNVVDAINLMVEEVAYLLRDVQQATVSVNTGAQEMIQVTDAVSASSDQTAREAEAARGDVQEVTSSIRQMSQSASQSATASQRALEASRQGEAAVTDTLEGMQGIRREVQAISKRIKSLGDRSLEISEIVETISQISSQTNLLALNAAIEASGAGAAGNRFAIVAGEVRKLAEDSERATQRIAGLIKNVQAEVQEVIGSVEDGTREVETGYRVATQAGERLREIGEIVTQSAALAQAISEATNAQVAGVEQVGSKVQSMAQIASQARETGQEGRQTAEKLQQLAEQLTANLERFRLA